MDILEILKNMREYLQLDSIMSYFIKQTFWLAIRGIIWISQFLDGFIADILKVAQIFENTESNTALNIFSGVATTIGVAALTIYAIRYMLDTNITIKMISDRLLIGAATLCFSGIIIAQLMTLTTKIGTSIIGHPSENNTMSTINENIVDMRKVITNGYLFDKAQLTDEEKLQSRTQITEGNLPYFDITETLNERDFDNDIAKDVVTKKLSVNENNELIVVDIAEEAFLAVEQHYYRYHWNPIMILLLIGTNVVAILIFGFKVARLMYEIVFNQILIPIYAYKDLYHGRELKAIVNNIQGAIVTIILTFVTLKVYNDLNLYVTEIEMGWLAKLVCRIALTLLLLDSPTIVQQITGIDAGLKSTGRALMGMATTAGMVGGGIAVAGSVLADNVDKVKDTIKSAGDKLDQTYGQPYSQPQMANPSEQAYFPGISDPPSQPSTKSFNDHTKKPQSLTDKEQYIKDGLRANEFGGANSTVTPDLSKDERAQRKRQLQKLDSDDMTLDASQNHDNTEPKADLVPAQMSRALSSPTTPANTLTDDPTVSIDSPLSHPSMAGADNTMINVEPPMTTKPMTLDTFETSSQRVLSDALTNDSSRQIPHEIGHANSTTPSPNDVLGINLDLNNQVEETKKNKAPLIDDSTPF